MVKDKEEKKINNKIEVDRDEMIAILRMLEAVKRKLQETLK